MSLWWAGNCFLLRQCFSTAVFVGSKSILLLITDIKKSCHVLDLRKDNRFYKTFLLCLVIAVAPFQYPLGISHTSLFLI